MDATLAPAPRDGQGCCACTDCGGTDNQQACFWDLNLRAPADLPSPTETETEGQDYFSAQENLSDNEEPVRRGSVSDRLKQSFMAKLGKKASAVRPADRSPPSQASTIAAKGPKGPAPHAQEGRERSKPTTTTTSPTSAPTPDTPGSGQRSSRRRRSRRRSSSRDSTAEPAAGDDPSAFPPATADEVVQLRRRCHELELHAAANSDLQGEVGRLKAALTKVKEQHRTALKTEKRHNEQLAEVLARQEGEVARLLADLAGKEVSLRDNSGRAVLPANVWVWGSRPCWWLPPRPAAIR